MQIRLEGSWTVRQLLFGPAGKTALIIFSPLALSIEQGQSAESRTRYSAPDFCEPLSSRLALPWRDIGLKRRARDLKQ